MSVLPALRLVEMQLRRAADDPGPEDFWTQQPREPEGPPSEMLRAYEARRCQVCQCKSPSFGFGPPLAPQTIWACRDHRAEVNRMLTENRFAQPLDQQKTLL